MSIENERHFYEDHHEYYEKNRNDSAQLNNRHGSGAPSEMSRRNALVTVLIDSYTAITAQLTDHGRNSYSIINPVADKVLSAWALLPVKYSSTEYYSTE